MTDTQTTTSQYLYRTLLALSILSVSVFAVKNKLPRRNAAWAALHAGRTTSEGIHGALDFNFKFDQNMYALQFQVFQVCVPDGCVSRPHSSYNFLYGRSYSLNYYTHYYFQSGIAAVQLRKNCGNKFIGWAGPGETNPAYVWECAQDTEAGIPVRAGILSGNFIGLSFELTGLLTPSYQIIGAQIGMPLGVF